MSRGPLVVVGDAMLDVDVEGDADRLCPDAPVPVVDVNREWQRPGGAGLAAKLAARSVSDVVLVAALGDDETGLRLAALLDGEVDLVRLPLLGRTPSKTRIRTGGHPVTRLDRGDGRAAAVDPCPDALAALRSAAAILVADYGRGVTANPAIRSAIADAADRVPVVWDPHPRGARPVPRMTLVTPNAAEARGFAGHADDPAALAFALRDRWLAGAVAVTVGGRGAVLAAPEVTRLDVPPDARTPAGSTPDTCGAGDRFASAATAALLDGADVRDAVRSAVATAARFIRAGAAGSVAELLARPGSHADGPESAFELAARIRRRGGTLVATGGCFDLLHAGHVRLVEQARAMGDALVVCVNSDESVRVRKGPNRPIMPVADRVRLVAALRPVDAVLVFDESTPATVLDRLAPDIWVKGGEYADAPMPEADVVRGHGGRVAFVPMLDGYSTTRLLDLAAGGRTRTRQPWKATP
jgi:rfaE bifunctional protein nucleotidyltransferase chain/domain/rfaE bifunctional protein kinase chain/domain